jgi:peptide/nickel transport system substrate-binding protein
MRSPLRARSTRILASVGLVGALLIPAAAPTAAADPVILRVGVTQPLDSINPYGTALVVGYEVYGLTYDLLVGFGPDAEPAPGFADSWERAADGKSWTFHIRKGMKWSDGTPATAADACFSFQINLDAIAAESNVGLGYIDPSVAAAGVTKAECPDDETMILTTSDPSDRVLQLYVPMLPKHIWGDKTYEQIGDDNAFGTPQVGTGPYQLTEWKTGEFTKFERNPNYWGKQGAADQIFIQEYLSADTLLQALKAGEVDYARGANAQQFDALKSEPDIATVAGQANGWTQLGFNTYGTGTGNTIEGGGPSTKALQDPAFRSALGYAIDKQELMDRILLGYGDIGTTPVPPILSEWHTEPNDIRTFDLAKADQMLTDAGYVKDASGNRLDKEGKVISLTMVFPNDDSNYAQAAQFIQGWYKDIGIKVTAVPTESGTLVNLMLPPEADGTADYDLFIWGWSWGPDPSGALEIFTCDAIGGSSDSLWCDSKYDELYAKQNTEGGAERKATLDEIQQYWYDQAPYHILFYDDNLHAYRTDKFANWQVQPKTGTPLFAYNTLNYTLLTLASDASPSPDASAGPSDGSSAAPATPAPSGDGGTGSTSSDNTLLIVGVLAVVAVVVGGLVLARRRGSAKDEDE